MAMATTLTVASARNPIETQGQSSIYATDATDNDDCKLIVPEDFEQQFLKTRVQQLYSTINLSKHVKMKNASTNGTQKYMQPPFNMLFHMKTQRKKPTKSRLEQNRFLSNAYYCLQHLRLFEVRVQLHHLYTQVP